MAVKEAFPQFWAAGAALRDLAAAKPPGKAAPANRFCPALEADAALVVERQAVAVEMGVV